MKVIQSVRGMNDLVGQDALLFQALMQEMDALFTAYQFEPLILPIVEKTELFARGIGQATDIIEKEMYTFIDRNEESLSLRPEGTAGCVRACLEHGLIHNQIRRFWYAGPMFRHERPQKGRYRQFYQIGAEVFGIGSPDIEAEMLGLLQQLWRTLNMVDEVQLEINTIGTLAERQAYRQTLVQYLSTYHDQLDADSQRRLNTNPLRILDSKAPETQAILANAPKLMDHLGLESKTHFEKLITYLEKLHIPYVINPKLVRGLDYYSHTVFEWTTSLLGAQATVCAGGRYDGLVAQLGGQATPAFGFAMGVERLLLLAAQTGWNPLAKKPVAYILTTEETVEQALTLTQKLRHDGFEIALNCGGGSSKSQHKRALQSGASVTLLAQSQNTQIEIRTLNQDQPTQTRSYPELVLFLRGLKQHHG